jgi:hypothetical protein
MCWWLKVEQISWRLREDRAKAAAMMKVAGTFYDLGSGDSRATACCRVDIDKHSCWSIPPAALSSRGISFICIKLQHLPLHHSLHLRNMADRRPGDESRAKRQKTEIDPADNPYLAHMNHRESNGGRSYGASSGLLSHFQRHASTTQQASKAEDGPSNPFNGNNLSDRYFSILKTRRDLPVHAQRYVLLVPMQCATC